MADKKTIIEPRVSAALQLAIQELDFGTVEVTVHDSRIVQIEVKKKIRFQSQQPLPDHRG